MQFFEIPLVKVVNNVVIIGTCAFTAYLLLVNLPWYLPMLGDGESVGLIPDALQEMPRHSTLAATSACTVLQVTDAAPTLGSHPSRPIGPHI